MVVNSFPTFREGLTIEQKRLVWKRMVLTPSKSCPISAISPCDIRN
jgi:hypothetical protein